ncbi:MAG: hypothetical protein U0787_22545 [Polyangia bacterium]
MTIRAGLAACLVIGLASCGSKEVPLLPEEISGHCNYVNKFSSEPECRNYHGDWPADKIMEDCADWNGTADIGTPCSAQSVLGQCILEKDGLYIAAQAIGDNPDKCAATKRGCELFGGGVFDAAPICGGVESSGSDGVGLPVFQQPVRVCKDPVAGEAAGQSAGGQVCTWEMISGVTEEGRHFEDYASCDRVRTQRPYYGAGTLPNNTREDPRLKDPTYATEQAWVMSQIKSAACVCCHSTKAPKGPSNWYVDQPGNFLNGFYDRGLAMGAGWLDTVGFGAYPPSENNGFSRATPDNPGHSIFPTQDDARMRRFFEKELAARGKPVPTSPGKSTWLARLMSSGSSGPQRVPAGKVSGPMDSWSGKEATRAMSTCLRPAQLPRRCRRTSICRKERCGALMSLPMASRSKAEP